jgi:hypothetical protein
MAIAFCDHGHDVYVAYDPTQHPEGCPECAKETKAQEGQE